MSSVFLWPAVCQNVRVNDHLVSVPLQRESRQTSRWRWSATALRLAHPTAYQPSAHWSASRRGSKLKQAPVLLRQVALAPPQQPVVQVQCTAIMLRIYK